MEADRSPPCGGGGGRAPLLAFLITEDWFFASHFLPMARAAREMGLDVLVITRVRRHRAVLEAAGCRVIALEAERRSLNPLAIAATFARLSAILAREKPAILHMIALRSILIGGFAARRAGVARRIFALTGLGFLGARRDQVGKRARGIIRAAMRGVLRNATTVFLFENVDDVRRLGLEPGDPSVAVVGGAGVDPDAFAPAPLPPQPPLKVAVVARMLWSKGIDLAVAATRLARAQGAAVELSLYGAPDPSNPKAIPEATLRQWAAEPGIAWHGRSDDVPAVWRDHHVACLPSRGGEGLPRTLLEAAACGRAIVTTDVPGCRSFVRDGIDGRVVAVDDAAAVAAALMEFAGDPGRVAACGAAARARLLDGHTERAVMDDVKAIYARLLAAPLPAGPAAAAPRSAAA
ncbi:glycosyltransferase [Chelatococcus reniformis]|uniref:Glycosyl transferase n=1 Tax=Chelatococcus reniformis TaxID=1494448 RepID=A0A916XPH4_9HYPH|nr:glycosyltransferase [Chelatococcus reniformis]GGC92993.1 glycosyl transferase [Chelatococcus reniformis]